MSVRGSAGARPQRRPARQVLRRRVVAPTPEESDVELLRRLRDARRDVRRAAAELAASRDEAPERYYSFIAELGPDELSHPDVNHLARRQDLVAADSFWRKVVERRRKKQLGTLPEKYLGLTKAGDLDFVNRIGLPTARVTYDGPYDALRDHVRPGSVVKPHGAAGANGAFYVFDLDHVVSIATSARLGSVEEMLAVAAVQLERWGGPATQQWQVQDLVLGGDGLPARDLKFFCFYGRIGLIMEIARYPEVGYAYFSGATLRPVRGGNPGRPRISPSLGTLTDTGGVSEEMFERVRSLSRQIPAPFVRIDFHAGADELVFCEFSAGPGRADLMPKGFDASLGRLYHRAEIELFDDVLAGKEFTHWRAFHADQLEARRPPTWLP